MRRSTAISVCMLMALLFLAGCGPTRIALKPTFWEQKDVKIGIAIAKYPEAKKNL